MSTRSATIERAVHVSAYVDLSLDDVVALFANAGIDGLLSDTLRTTLGADGDAGVRVHAEEPQRFARATATTSFVWQAPAGDGRAVEGTATVRFFRVRSGLHPMTELCVTLEAPNEVADSVALRARRFLDEFTSRLARAAV